MLVVGHVRARLLGLPLLKVDVHVIVGPPTGADGPVVDLRPGPGRTVRGTGRRSVRLARGRGRHARRSRSRSRSRLPAGSLSGGAALRRSAELVRHVTTVLDKADELSARA
jgi:hypothetical protein